MADLRGVEEFVAQRAPEPGKGISQATLDGREIRAGDARNCGQLEPAALAQQEDLALLRREPKQGAREALGELLRTCVQHGIALTVPRVQR
jgi:hypothetical protein